MNKNGLEIERKFLIEYPDCNFLLSLEKLRALNITQTYLLDDSRIRAIEENGETTYIKTVKKHITELVREEREWEISEEEYFSLLKNKKQGTNTIEKTRYAVEIGGAVYEIDVFGFWNDRAFLEIELEDENQQIEIPDFIKVIKEVTFDSRYKNYSLAKEIVTEKIH